MQALPVKAELNPAEIVRVESASLSAVNYGTGNTLTAQAVIAKLLLDTTAYFGISWTKPQITECAAMWVQEYYWMSMAEIKLFLSKLKAGLYSKQDYRHLSPFQLMGWLEEYTNELLVERAKFHDEREAAARYEREKARMTDPSMMAFDAVKAFQALGINPDEAAKATDDKEEIYRQEKIKQRQRDAQRQQQNEQP